MKNVIRSVLQNAFINQYLQPGDIQEFYLLIKEEQLKKQYWGKNSTMTNFDSSQPFYEMLKMDFDQFKPYFNRISAWAEGDNSEIILLRIFKLLDVNSDGYINFLQFLIAVILMSCVDAEMKIKLFYACHLVHLPQAVQTSPCFTNSESESDDEVALEATEFSEKSSSNTSSCSAEIIPFSNSKITIFDILPPQKSNKTPTSPGSPASSENSKGPELESQLPPMRQEQFIQMWRTLYDLFSTGPEEQQMNHVIASIGTALLKMGEMSQQQQIRKMSVEGCLQVKEDQGNNSGEQSEGFEVLDKEMYTHMVSLPDYWFITYEKFKATVLIEQKLAEFFEKKREISEVIGSLRSRRLIRTNTLVAS